MEDKVVTFEMAKLIVDATEELTLVEYTPSKCIVYDQEGETIKQFFYEGSAIPLSKVVEMIKDHYYNYGLSIGEIRVQNQIKNALGL